jgi:hypothetical protein
MRNILRQLGQRLWSLLFYGSSPKALTVEILDYYVSLGVCGLIVATDENAKNIKNYNISFQLYRRFVALVCQIVPR